MSRVRLASSFRRLLGRPSADDVTMEADAIDWTPRADGRPRRLKRGKHYFGETAEVEAAAHVAADAMGKVVSTSPEDLGRRGKHSYLWVQFVDHRIRPGAPCPCGGREFTRVHPMFVTCEACGAQSLVSDTAPLPPVEELGQIGEHLPGWYAKTGAKRRLETLADVHLRRYESTPEQESWSGWGRAETGERVLLIVDYPLAGGKHIPDPQRPGTYVHRANRFHAEPFAHAVDFDGLSA